MICNICETNSARLRHLTRTYGKSDSLLVVEDVPVVNCKHCGESYMTIETVRELELLKKQSMENIAKREVGVVSFA